MTGGRRANLGIMLLALGALVLAAIVLSLWLGAERLSLGEVVTALISPWRASPESVVIVRHLRLTRATLAFLVGAALAVSGMVMQGFFQNPMADPYLLGVSSGASLGATVGLLVAPTLPARLGLGALLGGDFGVSVALLAFTGALLVTFVVYVLSRVGGRTPVTTLLLTGIAIGSLASALSAYLYIRRPDGMEKVILWIMGTFQRSDWLRVATMAAVLAVGVAVVAAFTRDLDVLQMGDEAAQHLGVEVERVRKTLVVTASLLAATAVAAVGVIGFVGLVVPHLMRIVTGPKHERLLPACVLGGAALMILADLLSRVIHTAEVPVGIVTAFVGCPFFLFLLRQARSQPAA